MPPAQPRGAVKPSAAQKPDTAGAGAPPNPAAALAPVQVEPAAADPTAASAETIGLPPERALLDEATTGAAPRVVVVDEDGHEITGFDPDAEVSIALGTELACAPFETGELVIGHVRSVGETGVVLLLQDLGWLWPVKRTRIDLPGGEWKHVVADYPPPGADPVFDEEHRMSDSQRATLQIERAHEREAAAALQAEPRPAPVEGPRAHVPVEHRTGVVRVAAPPPRPENAPVTSVLCRWKGPGVYEGPWVRRRDGKTLEHADPSGGKDVTGYYPARSVQIHAALFERLDLE